MFLLCSWLVCCGAELNGVVATQWSGDDRNWTLQHKNCVENQQYLHQGLCCLNCQAGKKNPVPKPDLEPKRECWSYTLPGFQSRPDESEFLKPEPRTRTTPYEQNLEPNIEPVLMINYKQAFQREGNSDWVYSFFNMVHIRVCALVRVMPNM